VADSAMALMRRERRSVDNVGLQLMVSGLPRQPATVGADQRPESGVPQVRRTGTAEGQGVMPTRAAGRGAA